MFYLLTFLPIYKTLLVLFFVKPNIFYNNLRNAFDASEEVPGVCEEVIAWGDPQEADADGRSEGGGRSEEGGGSSHLTPPLRRQCQNVVCTFVNIFFSIIKVELEKFV